MIDINEIDYPPWGRCIKISNGVVDIVASLEFGPRILRYGFCGGENELFEDFYNKVMATASNSLMDEYYYKDAKFKMYGGHRVWASPQFMPETFYPDNERVEYLKTSNGAILTSTVQIKNNIQTEIEIELSDNSSNVTVKSRIANRGDEPKELSVWAITAMAPNGMAAIPQPNSDYGFIENRNMVLWKYTKMNDHRVYWGSRYIMVWQDLNVIDYDEFKFGINNEKEVAFYFNNNNMFVKTYKHLGNSYRNGNISFETYTSNCTLELESLGKYCLLRKDESAEHIEKWELFKGVYCPERDEDKMDKIYSKYIGGEL